MKTPANGAIKDGVTAVAEPHAGVNRRIPLCPPRRQVR